MEGSTGGLDVAALLQEVEVLQLVAVEVAAHVDALAPLDNTVSWPAAPIGRLWRPFGSLKRKEKWNWRNRTNLSPEKIGSLQMQKESIKTHNTG